MKVLLVEPDYYTRYPPLGLMKLAAMHRSYGNDVHLVHGIDESMVFSPKLIEVTSLFTFAWKPVHDAIRYYSKTFPEAKIRVGGIYASLLPEHILKDFPSVEIVKGLFTPAEKYVPYYDLLKDVEKWENWDSSILFTSRGCIRNCPFCVVPRIEGKIRSVLDNISPQLHPGFKKVIIWDNNFLASPNWRKNVKALLDGGYDVDFNQGLDARLVDEEIAGVIAEIKPTIIRMAYDFKEEKDAVTNATDFLSAQGIKRRNILFYSLYNFYDVDKMKGDTPEDFYQRVLDIAELGCTSYPMRYEPADSLKKCSFISPNWTEKELEMVAKARRVIGYGGAFPAYEGLVQKFRNAQGFEKAFILEPVKST